MPNHDDNLKRVCLLCMSKSRNMRNISENMSFIIREHFVPGYVLSDDRLPSVVCSTCQKVISDYSKGNFQRKIDTAIDQASIPPRTRSRDENCKCPICCIATSVPKNISKGMHS